jgi:hypothetical protein
MDNYYLTILSYHVSWWNIWSAVSKRKACRFVLQRPRVWSQNWAIVKLAFWEQKNNNPKSKEIKYLKLEIGKNPKTGVVHEGKSKEQIIRPETADLRDVAGYWILVTELWIMKAMEVLHKNWEKQILIG